MRVEETRQTVVPGLDLIVNWHNNNKGSVLVTIGYGDIAPINSGGPFALRVVMTEKYLQSILSGSPDAINLVMGCAAEDGTIRIPVHLSEVVGSIGRIVRGTTYKDAGRALFLQGKVLQLLAECIAARSCIDKETMEADIVKSIVGILLIYPFKSPDLPALSAHLGEPQRKLIDIFRAHYGMTITEWLANWRFNYARDQLLKCSMSVREISELLGYGNVSNFTTAFTKRFGVSPGRLRTKSVLSKESAATTSSAEKSVGASGVRPASVSLN